jgi:ankyrin repeat protein
MHLVVESGRFRLARRLVEAGADVTARDENGKTPLEVADSEDPEAEANVARLKEFAERRRR